MKIFAFGLLVSSLMLVGCASNRYIKEIKKTPVEYTPEYEAHAGGDSASIALDALLASAIELAESSEFVKNIKETIYATIDGKVAYTVEIDGQNITSEKGIAEGKKPTLVIPISKEILTNLNTALEDKKLSDQETFNFAHVLLIPCLTRMHTMPYLYDRNVSGIELDDFLHIRIKNDQNFTYHGQAVNLEATVLNVDGMYLVIRGLIGSPDILQEYTISEALALYKLVAYDAVNNKGKKAIVEGIKKYKEMVKKSTTYERAWH